MWAVGCIYAELLALRPIFKGEEAKISAANAAASGAEHALGGNKMLLGVGLGAAVGVGSMTLKNLPFQSDQMGKIVEVLGSPDSGCCSAVAQLVLTASSALQRTSGQKSSICRSTVNSCDRSGRSRLVQASAFPSSIDCIRQPAVHLCALVPTPLPVRHGVPASLQAIRVRSNEAPHCTGSPRAPLLHLGGAGTQQQVSMTARNPMTKGD